MRTRFNNISRKSVGAPVAFGPFTIPQDITDIAIWLVMDENPPDAAAVELQVEYQRPGATGWEHFGCIWGGLNKIDPITSVLPVEAGRGRKGINFPAGMVVRGSYTMLVRFRCGFELEYN